MTIIHDNPFVHFSPGVDKIYCNSISISSNRIDIAIVFAILDKKALRPILRVLKRWLHRSIHVILMIPLPLEPSI
jgi:hypothetical protein